MNDYALGKIVRSCWKKHRYPNEQSALEAINRVHKKRDTELRVYFCPQCLGYHLTSKILKERKYDKFKSSKINKCAITK